MTEVVFSNTLLDLSTRRPRPLPARLGSTSLFFLEKNRMLFQLRRVWRCNDFRVAAQFENLDARLLMSAFDFSQTEPLPTLDPLSSHVLLSSRLVKILLDMI